MSHETHLLIYATPAQKAAIEQARLAMRERIGNTPEGAKATASTSAFLRYCATAYGAMIDMGAEANAVAHAALVTLAMRNAADAGHDFRTLAPDQQRAYLSLAAQDAAAVRESLAGKVPA